MKWLAKEGKSAKQLCSFEVSLEIVLQDKFNCYSLCH